VVLELMKQASLPHQWSPETHAGRVHAKRRVRVERHRNEQSHLEDATKAVSGSHRPQNSPNLWTGGARLLNLIGVDRLEIFHAFPSGLDTD
jgi:hypothetical protein